MKKVLGIILGVLMCIGGFYCLMAPGLAFSSLTVIFGITLIEAAIAYFVFWLKTKDLPVSTSKLLINAILSLIAGIALLTNIFTQLFVETVMVYMIAIVMTARGIMQIAHAFDIKKAIPGSNWVLNLICGILVTISGIMCIINPLALSLAIGIIIAINIFTSGISLIVLSLSI